MDFGPWKLDEHVLRITPLPSRGNQLRFIDVLLMTVLIITFNLRDVSQIET